MTSENPGEKRTRFHIIRCPSCGRASIAHVEYATRRCPHCGVRFKTAVAMVLARAETSRDASLVLRRLKIKTSPLSEAHS